MNRSEVVRSQRCRCAVAGLSCLLSGASRGRPRSRRLASVNTQEDEVRQGNLLQVFGRESQPVNVRADSVPLIDRDRSIKYLSSYPIPNKGL